MHLRLLGAALTCAALLSLTAPAFAVYDVIVQPRPDGFWTQDPQYANVLQYSETGGHDGGGYYHVSGWGNYVGTPLASARVYYDLPDLPSGLRMYNLYAWNPLQNSTQWHAVEVNGDGSGAWPTQQGITAAQGGWDGQHGTNQQWLAFSADNPGIPKGEWIQLGSNPPSTVGGPQSDPMADNGFAVYMNPSHGAPNLFVQFQPWYFGDIAFAAIRVVEYVPEPPSVPGDFNGDGNVDGADFVIWQTNFPNNNGDAELSTGDANGDGNVDGADFVIWQTNFPFNGGSSIAPVPEPGAAVLGLIGAVFLGGVARAKLNRRRKGG